MFDPRVELLATVLRSCAADRERDAWAEARDAFARCGEEDADVADALERRDREALDELTSSWTAGTRVLLKHDREVLKRAMRCFRRSVDDERRRREEALRADGFVPLDGTSGELVIRPPEEYPIEVWDELARHDRLVDRGNGAFALPAD